QAAGPQRVAQRDLTATRLGAYEEEVGDVAERDAQEEPDCGQEDPEVAGDVAHDCLLELNGMRAEPIAIDESATVCVGECLDEARVEAGQLARCILRRCAWGQAGERAEPHVTAPELPGEAELQRALDVRHQVRRDLRGELRARPAPTHHLDAPRVDAARAADPARIAAVLPLPVSGRETCDERSAVVVVGFVDQPTGTGRRAEKTEERRGTKPDTGALRSRGPLDRRLAEVVAGQL